MSRALATVFLPSTDKLGYYILVTVILVLVALMSIFHDDVSEQAVPPIVADISRL